MSAKTTNVGCAYLKTTKDGRQIIDVTISNPVGPDFHYTLWPNENKQNDRQPDFTATKESDASKRERLANAITRPSPARGGSFPTNGTPEAASSDFPSDEVAEDDIPF